LPRKKIPTDLRSLARGHTELCIKVLAGIVSQEAVPPAAHVSAAGILPVRHAAFRREAASPQVPKSVCCGKLFGL